MKSAQAAAEASPRQTFKLGKAAYIIAVDQIERGLRSLHKSFNSPKKINKHVTITGSTRRRTAPKADQREGLRSGNGHVRGHVGLRTVIPPREVIPVTRMGSGREHAKG